MESDRRSSWWSFEQCLVWEGFCGCNVWLRLRVEKEKGKKAQSPCMLSRQWCIDAPWLLLFFFCLCSNCLLYDVWKCLRMVFILPCVDMFCENEKYSKIPPLYGWILCGAYFAFCLSNDFCTWILALIIFEFEALIWLSNICLLNVEHDFFFILFYLFCFLFLFFFFVMAHVFSYAPLNPMGEVDVGEEEK